MAPLVPLADSFLIIDPPPADPAPCRLLEEELKIPRGLAAVLVRRGVDTAEKVKAFFRHNLDNLGDPLHYKGMADACRLLGRALAEKQLVVIWGDYDVDGVTATALLHNCLASLGGRVRYYIPSRFGEGYGLSADGIREVAGWGAALLLAVDTGITAGPEVALARSLGLAVVVVDHHLPVEGRLPADCAMVDPRQPGCEYPDKDLAAVGLAFKLAGALYRQAGRPPEEVRRFLDLVALGTAADVVPLRGENRALVHFGLLQLAQTANEGLRLLLQAAQISPDTLSTRRLLFNLAPVLDAAGRLGEAERGVRLLLEEETGGRAVLARELVEENRKRQGLDQSLTEACVRQVQGQGLEETFFITLAGEDWHPGVLGIVASRLVEAFHRPSLVISLDETGEGKGSLRGVEGYHLVEALSSCADLLLKFGGHQFAAGLTVRRENLPELFRRLNGHARQRLAPPQFRKRIKPDATLTLAEIDQRFMKILNMFEPFGQGNFRPVFHSAGCVAASAPRLMGGGKHLRVSVMQENTVFPCVAFQQADLEEGLSVPGRRFSLYYTVEENEWQGARTLQLNVKGLRFED